MTSLRDSNNEDEGLFRARQRLHASVLAFSGRMRFRVPVPLREGPGSKVRRHDGHTDSDTLTGSRGRRDRVDDGLTLGRERPLRALAKEIKRLIAEDDRRGLSSGG